MDIEEDIKILQEFTELDRKLRNYKVESDYDNFCERRCVAIDHILAEREEDKKRIKELEVLEDDLKDKRIVYVDTPEFEEKFIAKQKVKEELEKAEKENVPYEEYNKESRAYWINQGRISLAKKIIGGKIKMYKYFISYMFSDKENHSGFGNTVCSSEKKITDLDAIIEIENNIKEVSIQQEDDEYTRYIYKNSKVTILNFTLLEGK